MQLENKIKGLLKRHIKITMATLVAFLITGTPGFSFEIPSEKLIPIIENQLLDQDFSSEEEMIEKAKEIYIKQNSIKNQEKSIFLVKQTMEKEKKNEINKIIEEISNKDYEDEKEILKEVEKIYLANNQEKIQEIAIAEKIEKEKIEAVIYKAPENIRNINFSLSAEGNYNNSTDYIKKSDEKLIREFKPKRETSEVKEKENQKIVIDKKLLDPKVNASDIAKVIKTEVTDPNVPKTKIPKILVTDKTNNNVVETNTKVSKTTTQHTGTNAHNYGKATSGTSYIVKQADANSTNRTGGNGANGRNADAVADYNGIKINDTKNTTNYVIKGGNGGNGESAGWGGDVGWENSQGGNAGTAGNGSNGANTYGITFGSESTNYGDINISAGNGGNGGQGGKGGSGGARLNTGDTDYVNAGGVTVPIKDGELLRWPMPGYENNGGFAGANGTSTNGANAGQGGSTVGIQTTYYLKNNGNIAISGGNGGTGGSATSTQNYASDGTNGGAVSNFAVTSAKGGDGGNGGNALGIKTTATLDNYGDIKVTGGNGGNSGSGTYQTSGQFIGEVGKAGKGGDAIGIESSNTLNNYGFITVKGGNTGNLTYGGYNPTKNGVTGGQGGSATGINTTGKLYNEGRINITGSNGGAGQSIGYQPGNASFSSDAGTGGNGGFSVGINSNNDIKNNGDIVVIGGTGGNGGAGAWAYHILAPQGTGGNGGDGSYSVGIVENGNNKTIENNGNFYIKAGNGGTGGEGGTARDRYDDSNGWLDGGVQGGDGGNGGNGGTATAFLLNGTGDIVVNSGSVVAIKGTGGQGGKGGASDDGPANACSSSVPGRCDLYDQTNNPNGSHGGYDSIEGNAGVKGNDGYGYIVQGNSAKIENKGLMIASTSIVKGNNNTVNNYGIFALTDTTNFVDGTGNVNKNYGITMKTDEKGNVISVIDSSNGSTAVIDGVNYTTKHMDGTINSESNKILNATNTTKNLVIDNKNINYDKVIINGASNGATLDIKNGSNVIAKDTVINGTTRAMDIENATFTGSNVNMNATNLVDKNILVIGDNAHVTLTDGSIVSGDIDLNNTAGNKNSLKVINSSVTGDIKTGNGDSDVHLESSYYLGVMDFSGTGDTKLTLVNMNLKNEIKTGTGDKNFSFDRTSYTHSNLDFTSGDNTLTLKNGAEIVSVSFGNGNDTFNQENSKNTLDIDLKNGNNNLNMSTGIINGNVSSGNGNDNFNLNNSLIKKDNGTNVTVTLGDGNNSLKMKDSAIYGSVSSGNGSDVLTFNDSAIFGMVSLGDGKKTIGMIGSGIDGGLITGTGDLNLDMEKSSILGEIKSTGGTDNIRLSESYVGGNVSLGDGTKTIGMIGSGIDGGLITGTGNLNLDMEKSSILGEIKSTDGTDNIRLSESYVGGNVSLGDGTKTIGMIGSGIDGGLITGAGDLNLDMGKSSIQGDIVSTAGTGNIILDDSYVKGAIKLSDGDNEVSLIASGVGENIILGLGNDKIALDGSSVKKEILLGEGNNEVTAKGSSMGSIIAGIGNDIATLYNSLVTGDLNLGAGENKISLVGSGVDGNLITGNGNDEVSLNSSRIEGNINLGDGNNRVNLSGSAVLNGLITGTGDDSLSLDKSIIENGVALGEGNNKLSLKNSSIKGNITTGIGNDELIFENSSAIKSNVSLGDGENKLSLSNSGIGGNVSSGIGNDEINLSKAVIEGDVSLGEGNNTIKLTENSVITGKITTGSGDDSLTLDLKENSTVLNGVENKLMLKGNPILTYYELEADLGNGTNNINLGNDIYLVGNIKGGTGTDTINLIGSNQDSQLVLQSNITDVDKIQGKGTLILKADNKFSFTEQNKKLDLDVDGRIYLGIDKTKLNSNDEIIGHTLNGIDSTVNVSDKFIVDTSTIDKNQVISMQGTDTEFTDEQLYSDSILHGIYEKENGDFQVVVDESIPIEGMPDREYGYLHYNELNKIYESIFSAEQVGKLSADIKLSDKETEEEAFIALLDNLNQIYGNNVYGYSQKLSMDSLKSYTDITIKNLDNSEVGEWNVHGATIGEYRENKNKSVSSGYYDFDHKNETYKIDTVFTGLMGIFNYGVTDKFTSGFAIGGAKQINNFSKDSKLKGNSWYLGQHNKYKDNLYNQPHTYSFGLGGGVQLNKYYDVERNVSTKYQTSRNGESFSTQSANIYGSAEFNYHIENDFIITPKYQFTAVNTYQRGISESVDKDSIAIQTNSNTQNVYSNYFELALEKTYDWKEWDYTLKGFVGYTRNSGDLNNVMRARVLGEGKTGSDFDFIGGRVSEEEKSIGINLDLKKENMKYSIYYNYSDDKNSGKSENVGVGFTYKFDKLEEFIPKKIK